MKNQLLLLLLVSSLSFQCTNQEKPIPPAEKKPTTVVSKTYMTTGAILRKSPELDKLIAAGTPIEIIGEGFEWSEGPLWVPPLKALLFSDVPQNKIYKWTEENGIEDYLYPSGFTDTVSGKGEAGSNGLLLSPKGELILCQHGDRRVGKMDAPIDRPRSTFVTLTDKFQGKRYNSPNDLCITSKGEYFFTDPPYGLPGGEDDPSKELDKQGVYRWKKGKESVLFTDQLSRPNGIAFSPDEKTLYIANSDPEYAVWMKYVFDENGMVTKNTVFHNATVRVGKVNGLPDGLKVHSSGVIFASGPGGVWIFQPDGTQIGTIRLDQACSNVAFNDDETALFITADHQLLRVKLVKN